MGAIEQGEEYLSGFIGGKVRLRTAYAKGNAEKIYPANGIVGAFLNQTDFRPIRFLRR